MADSAQAGSGSAQGKPQGADEEHSPTKEAMDQGLPNDAEYGTSDPEQHQATDRNVKSGEKETRSSSGGKGGKTANKGAEGNKQDPTFSGLKKEKEGKK